MSQPVILAANATLKGRDLQNVYHMTKVQPDPAVFNMFKKKENLADMPKSLLKHKVQTLTGKALSEIEEEMGFTTTREGGGIPIEVLRKLAHYLILDASGQLEAPPRQSPQKEFPNNGNQDLPEPEVKRGRPGRKSVGPALTPQPTGPKRGSRKSLNPQLLQNISVTDTVACRLQQNSSVLEQTIEENMDVDVAEEEEEIKDEDLGLGPNPTPMMIAMKRRSLAAKKAAPVKKGGGTPGRRVSTLFNPSPALETVRDESPEKVVPKVSPRGRKPVIEKVSTPVATKRTVAQRTPPSAALKRSAPENNSPGPSKQARITSPQALTSRRSTKAQDYPELTANLKCPEPGFPGSESAKIYLASGNPLSLNHDHCKKIAPGFEGANLTIVHTPVDWSAMEIFNLTKNIKKINATANLESFIMLVGCGISNAHLLRDALLSQTQQVQIVVFDRSDQGLEDHKEGDKLRDVVSFFLIAYFFPGCQNEGTEPPEPMVRPGFTNCFKTKSVEDLENKIVYALSEQGDWILDLCCLKREISLAAQKTGRNAIAIDQSTEMLFMIKEKASIIAEHHDKSFRKNTDGIIQRF